MNPQHCSVDSIHLPVPTASVCQVIIAVTVLTTVMTIVMSKAADHQTAHVPPEPLDAVMGNAFLRTGAVINTMTVSMAVMSRAVLPRVLNRVLAATSPVVITTASLADGSVIPIMTVEMDPMR